MSQRVIPTPNGSERRRVGRESVMYAAPEWNSEGPGGVQSRPRPAEPPVGQNDTLRILSYFLLPAGLILWAIAVAKTDQSGLGMWGLMSIVPAVFYVGIALVIVSIGIELSRAELSQFRLALHSVALVLILYGTAPLVYSAARYSWLYKTIGIIQYVAANGKTNPSIDIYQHFPAFFALAAWFDKVAGVSTPIDYAKWAQLVFELAVLPLLYSIYRSLALPVRGRWLGIFLYSGSNWIGQDYLSDQAMGTLLSLGIMAIVLRWMFVSNASGQRFQEEEPASGYGRSGGHRMPAEVMQRRPSVPVILAVIVLLFVLVSSTELSPYIVTLQLFGLLVAGLLRWRWVPLLAAVITLGFLAPNFTYINEHYGLLASAGKFFGNIQTTGGTSGNVVTTPAHSQVIVQYFTDLLSLTMWVLALIGAWVRRKSRRTVIGLLFLTFSPIVVLAGGSYGGEGVLRVYLFSLPWAAALAASALVPLWTLRDNRKLARLASRSGSRNLLDRFDRGTLRAPVTLAIVVAMFIPSFFGTDFSTFFTTSEVNTVASFMNKAKPGPIMIPVANAPGSDTSRYNQFPTASIFGSFSILGKTKVTSASATYLAREVDYVTASKGPGYVLITPSMTNYNKTFGDAPQSDFTTLDNSMAKSPYWTVMMNDHQGTIVYQISAAGLKLTLPKGSYNPNPSFTVP